MTSAPLGFAIFSESTIDGSVAYPGGYVLGVTLFLGIYFLVTEFKSGAVQTEEILQFLV